MTLAPDERPRGTARDDAFAARLRGFGPLGLLAILVVLAGDLLASPLSAVLVLVWAWRSRTPWASLGLARPRRWATSLAGGVAFGIVFKLVMKSVVMPLFGAPPENEAYRFLQGNTAALPGMLFAVVVGAGFGEETFFRGYLFERLGRLLGRGALATAATVVLTSALFGLAHLSGQGWPGVQQATVVGLVFAVLFARTRSLWMLMAAHAAFDVVALALIYFRFEAPVAHLFFR